MKTRRLFLQYMKYAAAVLFGYRYFSINVVSYESRTYRQLEIIN